MYLVTVELTRYLFGGKHTPRKRPAWAACS